MNLKNKYSPILFLILLAIVFYIYNRITKFNVNSERTSAAIEIRNKYIKEKMNSNVKKKYTNININRKEMRQIILNSKQFLTRDYIYYKCKERRRIGGDKYDEYRPLQKNNLERFDGAWFVCFDGNLGPLKNDCNILSFGIDWDDSFDFEINNDYGCTVHSFDPFKEAARFTAIRKNNPKLKDSLYIDVNKNWRFYSLGVTGSNDNIKNPNQKGGIDTLDNILERFKLKNKIIDVFKVDIEGSEDDLLANLDIDYACRYFKQFMIETHVADLNYNLIFVLLQRLEQCFSLFHRDSRLIGPNFKGETFLESNKKNGIKIDSKYFNDETTLTNFLISAGELYFVNENFL